MSEKKEEKYILEGIFTEFETRNINTRIYPYPPIILSINRMNKIKKIFNVGG